MRFDRAVCLGTLAAAAVATPAIPQQTPPVLRFEAPIREVRLSDGVRRYGVPVRIGARDALAGLDTGAVGLRLRPDAPGYGEARKTGRAEDYAFGSGAHLDGVGGQVRLTIGSASGTVPVHLVDKIGCVPRQPQCPGLLGLGYGFLGDGLAGEGFRLLIGTNMGSASIGNPLMALGAKRWIVHLPRPGETGDGALIANPTDEEIKGFVMVPLAPGYRETDGGLHDAVWACLTTPDGRQRACGPALLDTGGGGLRVNNVPFAVKPGQALRLDLMSDGLTVRARVRLTAGDEAQRVVEARAPIRGTVLQPGVAAYWAFDVLYDPGRKALGFRARSPMAGLPAAEPIP